MNLQISLLILGLLAIVAIYFFSRWQESKQRNKRNKSKVQPQSDGSAVAPVFERGEPSFDQGGAGSDSGTSPEPPVIDHYAGDYVDADQSAAAESVTSGDLQSRPDDDWQVADTESYQADVPVVEEQATFEEPADSNDMPDQPAPPELGEEEMVLVAESPADIPVLENQVDVVEEGAVEAPMTASQLSVGDFVDEVETLTDAIELPNVSATAEPVYETATDIIEPADPVEEEVQEVEYVDLKTGSVQLDEIAAEPSLSSGEAGLQTSLLDDGLQHDSDVSGVQNSNMHDEEQPEEAYADAKPSLKAFLGSIGPINKIKENIQNQLESVKADRERTLRGEDKPRPDPKPMPVEDTQQGYQSEPPVASFEAETEINLQSDASDFDDTAAAAPDLTPDLPSVSGPMTPVSDQEYSQPAAFSGTETQQTDGDIENQQGTALITPAEGFDKLSQIDYYVKLSGERDVSRDSVLAIYRECAAGIMRTHSIYGLRLPDKVWRDLEHEPEEARFGDLVVTIQLVDQTGMVTENDMTRFSSLIMKLSESTGRGFSFMAPIENAHRQAEAITEFKNRFDSIFVVNIRPLESEMFEGAIIERCAQQIGLTPDENQFFTRYKPVGKQKVCLYSLANMSDTGEFDLGNMRAVRTRGVTFFTRPAINRSPGAVFSEMVDAAKAFASRIKGEVIAPGYDDLSTDDVETIRHSIEAVAEDMESYGINPGSEEATRLFG